MQALKLPNVLRLKTGTSTIFSIEVPRALEAEYRELVRRSPERLDVELCAPRKARSTGKHSQNHRLNGFIQQICVATFNDFPTIKQVVKMRAIARGYPFKTYRGIVVPQSEADASTVECGLLIDEVEQLAAEEGIRLVECEDE